MAWGGGWKIPILISNQTKIKITNIGKISVLARKRFGVQIGFDGTEGIIENKYSSIYINGILQFNGDARISKGSSIRVDGGSMVFGKNFFCNKNCFISCGKGLIIGNDVLLGWNVNIRDNSGHKIYVNGKENILSDNISKIGAHVWLASYVDITHTVHIPSGCIVAYRSCLVSDVYDEENTLIAGYPAQVKKRGVTWEK